MPDYRECSKSVGNWLRVACGCHWKMTAGFNASLANEHFWEIKCTFYVCLHWMSTSYCMLCMACMVLSRFLWPMPFLLFLLHFLRFLPEKKNKWNFTRRTFILSFQSVPVSRVSCRKICTNICSFICFDSTISFCTRMLKYKEKKITMSHGCCMY